MENWCKSHTFCFNDWSFLYVCVYIYIFFDNIYIYIIIISFLCIVIYICIYLHIIFISRLWYLSICFNLFMQGGHSSHRIAQTGCTGIFVGLNPIYIHTLYIYIIFYKIVLYIYIYYAFICWPFYSVALFRNSIVFMLYT